MTLLEEKLKEVLAAIAPIVVIVVLLSLTLVKIEKEMMGRFFIGSVFLLIGLAIFLVGVDLGMTPMGKYLGETVGSSKTYFSLIAMSFLIGFSVTAAEPDLAILGAQIESATGGALPQAGIVLIVSVGVGIMIALGVLRILRGFSIHRFFLIAYAAIACISVFSKNEFIAMAFDSSGATTGALTTPFVLVLCGASDEKETKRRHDEEAEVDI